MLKLVIKYYSWILFLLTTRFSPIQEERQCNVGNLQNRTLAFDTRVSNKKNDNKPTSIPNQSHKTFIKDSPFCIHCKKTGHTQDKCYRLHGFPPGYRTQSSQSHANYVDVDQCQSYTQTTTTSNVHDALTALTQQQCENLIAMLSGQLASVNVVNVSTNHATVSENLEGKYRIVTLNVGNYLSNVWILESGATRHICNDKGIFTNMQSVTRTRVRLPNHSLIQVHFKGHIQLTNELLLIDVLYVHQFELNLMSVTCLTKSQLLMVKFYHNFSLIEQILPTKMIGGDEVHEGLYLLDVPTSIVSTIVAISI